MAREKFNKFVQPDWAVHVIGEGRSDDEIREAQNRIRQGEPSEEVWADIDARVAARERRRLGLA